MATKYYLGVVEKEAVSAFGMWFPDMPGCFPAADDFDDLPRVAAEMLRQHVEALESNGRDVPAPRSVALAMSDKIVRKALKGGATTILVPLLADPSRTVRVNVTVERGLLEQIDEAAKSRRLTRSAFLAQAAREKIAG
ncbi:MAG: type II toxin-antitoxin system HicB family antitoxin [Alphaproteobacteria bacterium]